MHTTIDNTTTTTSPTTTSELRYQPHFVLIATQVAQVYRLSYTGICAKFCAVNKPRSREFADCRPEEKHTLQTGVGLGRGPEFGDSYFTTWAYAGPECCPHYPKHRKQISTKVLNSRVSAEFSRLRCS